MNRHSTGGTVCAMVVAAITFNSSWLVGQELGPPRYRPVGGAARATRTLDSVMRLDSSQGAKRRVLIDTAGGAFAARKRVRPSD